MTAVEYIYANMDTQKVLEALDFNTRVSGDKLRAKCIMHSGHSDSSFVADEESGLWTCHGGCGSGSIFQLVMKIKDLDFVGSMKWIASVLSLTLDGHDMNKSHNSNHNDLKHLQEYVRKLRKEALQTFTYNVDEEPCKSFRSFNEETLSAFNMRTTPKFPFVTRNDKFFYTSPKYIFDLDFEGKTIGVALRRIDEDEKIKWSFQPTSLRKKDMLYNYDNALAHIKENKLSSIYVVEGIFDAMAFWQAGIKNVIALLGTSISEAQRILLMKLASDVILCLDGDEAGRQSMLKLSKELKTFFKVKVLLFEDGEDPETKLSELNEESKKAIPLYMWDAFTTEEKLNGTKGNSKKFRSNGASKWR